MLQSWPTKLPLKLKESKWPSNSILDFLLRVWVEGCQIMWWTVCMWCGPLNRIEFICLYTHLYVHFSSTFLFVRNPLFLSLHQQYYTSLPLQSPFNPSLKYNDPLFNLVSTDTMKVLKSTLWRYFSLVFLEIIPSHPTNFSLNVLWARSSAGLCWVIPLQSMELHQFIPIEVLLRNACLCPQSNDFIHSYFPLPCTIIVSAEILI